MMLPTRPRCTASGLTMIKVRSRSFMLSDARPRLAARRGATRLHTGDRGSVGNVKEPILGWGEHRKLFLRQGSVPSKGSLRGNGLTGRDRSGRTASRQNASGRRGKSFGVARLRWQHESCQIEPISHIRIRMCVSCSSRPLSTSHRDQTSIRRWPPPCSNTVPWAEGSWRRHITTLPHACRRRRSRTTILEAQGSASAAEAPGLCHNCLHGHDALPPTQHTRAASAMTDNTQRSILVA